MTAARARRERDWLAFLIGYRHGLRCQEILNLTRADVEGGFIVARRLKGSETTVQPLLEDANPLFDERAAVPVFTRNLSENQRLFDISPRQLERTFAARAAEAGLPKFKRHPHVLKHTCATDLLPIAGIAATQAWLGHKSGSSTLIYTKMTQEDAAAAVRRALSLPV